MDYRRVALFSGPLLFLLIAFMPTPAGMTYAAQITAAFTLWIAIWWITEPINAAAISSLPLGFISFSMLL
ncbi:MAG: anion permease [Saprospiraceae bacterium]|nr:anion permease [Saprospiraceae bacterium]